MMRAVYAFSVFAVSFLLLSTTVYALSKGTIFVTSTQYDPNFGGVSGADSKCMGHAQAAGLGGSWVALISDSTTNAKDRIPDAIYHTTTGQIIANSKDDLFDGSISSEISSDEQGNYVPRIRAVLTGTKADGTAQANNCNNWNYKAVVAGPGQPYWESWGYVNSQDWSGDGWWIAAGEKAMCTSGSIYCVLLESIQDKTCPTCSLPSSWTTCTSNTQSRTNYKCDSTTNYQCQSYLESQSCASTNQTCPICSSPSAWSTCSNTNNTQSRTNYKCDSSTNYQCQSYLESQSCTPTSALPQCSEGPIPSSGCKCQGSDKYSGYCCHSLLVNSLVWTNVPCTQTCKSMGGVCCYGAVSDCVGTWNGQWATDCQGYVCCVGTCKGTVLPATSCLSNCPSSPAAWTPCMNNTQIRTNYKCDSTTNYLCDAYTETQPCTSTPKPPPPTTAGYCGDNVCSGNETSATCPNDCVSPVILPTTPPSSPNVTIPPQPIIQPNLTTPQEKTIPLPVPTPLPSPVQSPQPSVEPTKPLPAVDRLRLAQSILTIESLKIKFETLKSKSQSLLSYYIDKNSTQNVAKWNNVVDLFSQAVNALDSIKSFISSVKDTATEGDSDGIASRIDNVLLIIDKVIDVMLSG